MVAIKAAGVSRFLNAPPDATKLFLFYGPDQTLSAARARDLAKALAARHTPPAEIIRLTERDHAEAPERLAIEARTLSMFGAAPVILAETGARFRPKLLADILSGPFDASLILTAGNLKPGSALRKLVEGDQQSAALPCYANPQQDIPALIETELLAYGLQVEREARQALIETLGQDYGVAQAELEKLRTYMLGGNEPAPAPSGQTTITQTTITMADLTAIIAGLPDPSIDRLITAMLSGRTAAALTSVTALKAGGQAVTGILSLLHYHLLRLLELRCLMDGGQPVDQAMKRLRPPVFFKQQPQMRAQATNWPTPRLLELLAALDQAVIRTRHHPDQDWLYLERLILQLAPKR